MPHCKIDDPSPPSNRGNGEHELTAARLRELLTYNPNTGLFRWRSRRAYARVAACDAATGKVYRDIGYTGQHFETDIGTLDEFGHRQIMIDGSRYMAHRLAWLYVYGEWPTRVIDHINRDPDDNRIVNLRDVSQSDNCHNARLSKNNKTGKTGVCKTKSGKWSARIRRNGVDHNLGQFDTFDAAVAARQEAERRLVSAAKMREASAKTTAPLPFVVF